MTYRRRLVGMIIAALSLGVAMGAPAAGAAGVRLTPVGGAFDRPVHVTAAPNDGHRTFVVEQAGRIWVLRDGVRLPTPFLDLTGQVSRVGSERGLLSLAFAPDYARTGRFYVDYTARQGGTVKVVEFRRSGDPDRANPASARDVLSQFHPDRRHNGGLLLFGPDRLLYVGIGDGGGSNDQHGKRGNGQNLGTFLGKILRIDPRATSTRPYTIPTSNPFVHRRGARREIYAYGLRNPWRFSFDRATGDLAIGDVGQDHFEEIDFARHGGARAANFGWRPFEGRFRLYSKEPAKRAVAPVLTYAHTGHRCAITGGYVVRDPRLKDLVGQYVYGDFCTGQLRSVRLRPGRAAGDRSA
ncbi:MAG: PQQ-dependent sugar dehydrogenase, partial [Actinomycetota bacterium]|nr:PQQ-dependent sugar dehydrogenase [Actinomycetota bacterium]